MTKHYLFQSLRLGFRNWTSDDLTELATINADPEVMKHFPKTLSSNETAALIKRLQQHFKENGFNYFATEIIATGELIGFIGFAYQDYQSAFTPAIDIGWRLKKSAWGKGFATEGAKRCLEYGFQELNLTNIIAVCTLNNTPSENVMQKIGMAKLGTFKHPSLKDYPDYEQCICYIIRNKNFTKSTFP